MERDVVLELQLFSESTHFLRKADECKENRDGSPMPLLEAAANIVLAVQSALKAVLTEHMDGSRDHLNVDDTQQLVALLYEKHALTDDLKKIADIALEYKEMVDNCEVHYVVDDWRTVARIVTDIEHDVRFQTTKELVDAGYQKQSSTSIKWHTQKSN